MLPKIRRPAFSCINEALRFTLVLVPACYRFSASDAGTFSP